MNKRHISDEQLNAFVDDELGSEEKNQMFLVLGDDEGLNRAVCETRKLQDMLRYAYRDRRAKKRSFRGLWIQRINAGARQNGLTYSQFMNGIKKAGIEIDRKVLADLAAQEPDVFGALAQQAKSALVTTA